MERKKFEEYVFEKYAVKGDSPWINHPTFSVFRHADSKKWFAVIMEISKSKIGIDEDGNINVVNLKCDPLLMVNIIEQKGIYRAYHMSKAHWITVCLDGSVAEEQWKWLVDISYELTKTKIKNR